MAGAGIQRGKEGCTEVTKLISTRMQPSMVNGATRVDGKTWHGEMPWLAMRGHQIKHLKGRGRLPSPQGIGSSGYVDEQKPME